MKRGIEGSKNQCAWDSCTRKPTGKKYIMIDKSSRRELSELYCWCEHHKEYYSRTYTFKILNEHMCRGAVLCKKCLLNVREYML